MRPIEESDAGKIMISDDHLGFLEPEKPKEKKEGASVKKSSVV